MNSSTLMLRRLGALLLILLAGLMASPVHAGSYTFRSDNYAWESASNAVRWSGTCTSYPGDDDKADITLTGGFVFPFAGANHSSVRIISNGSLQLGADTGFFRTYRNSSLPAPSTGAFSTCAAGPTTNTLMAYWTDLDPSRSGSGNVTWEQKGTAPNRYLVVSWNSVYQYGAATPYAFQIILFENGEFKYQYGNANASGSNATIGVQVSNADYTLYAYNSGYNANGSALRWFIPSGTPTRRADYRFDESSYSGNLGEVVDSSGNSNHGSRIGSAGSSASGYVCRALSIPSSATNINAADSSLNVSSGIGNTGSVSFWYRANSNWNSLSAQLLDATMVSSRPFFLVRQSNGSLRFSVSDSAGTVSSAATAALSYSSASWQHVAVSWRLAAGSGQSTVRVYINGQQLAASSGTSTGLIEPGLGTLYIGGKRSSSAPANASPNSANGLIDELRIYNYEISMAELTSDMSVAHACAPQLHHVEVTPSSLAASTCAPLTLTLRACADAACSVVLTGYTGTVSLSTSTGRGDWEAGAAPPPSGDLTNGAANDGAASYRFATGDAGVVTLGLRHSLAQRVSVTAQDAGLPASSTSSAAIQYRDNAFVWTEDLANKIAGTGVVVAGRNHDLRVALWKKDPATGLCGVAADFNGSRYLKLWRTDSGATWTAPAVVVPALTVPGSRPAGNNLALSFAAGLADLNLSTTDIGKYTLNLDDDSLSYAATTISGSSADLTVRPFTLAVSAVTLGGVNNPNGSGTGDAKFGAAGSNFSATVAAYRWAAAADSNGDGLPDTGVTLAQVSAGGLATGFNTGLNLSPMAGSQTPAGGSLGVLNNGTVSGFSGGSKTLNSLQYTEVGSFAFTTSALVSNYLGSTGVNLDAIIFNAAGTQNNRVGRFVPAGFALSAASVQLRPAAACTVASSFNYLDENFQLGFTLAAQNALGATTLNYTGGFAKLDLSSASNFQLAGIQGSTVFKTSGTARLALGTSSGSWNNGVAANIALVAQGLRASTADGPFDAAQFGIAPTDSDGVQMSAFNLDTDSPANGADRSLLATVPLRYGRLRLQNGIGSQDRAMKLPLLAQYWNLNSFQTNTQDSCTKILSSHLSFGNHRKTLTTADSGMSTASVTVSAGVGAVLLNKPTAGRSGSFDLAISLGSTASDSSCLQSWTPSKPATAGANLSYLRTPWCSPGARDPSARASFGLYRGNDALVYQRENY